MKKYIIEILKLIMILTVVLNIVSYYKSQDINKSKLNLPSLTLIDETSYKSTPDKPLLIYFWATWCPICKIESGYIESLSKKFNVLTIAVDSGSNNEISQYIKEHDLSFKVYNDQDKRVSQKFNIKGYPTILIYDKDHNLQFSDVGYTSEIALTLKMWWTKF